MPPGGLEALHPQPGLQGNSFVLVHRCGSRAPSWKGLVVGEEPSLLSSNFIKISQLMQVGGFRGNCELLKGGSLNNRYFFSFFNLSLAGTPLKVIESW